MQDLIIALYEDHSNAMQARTKLVKDGFPTDRVQLTSPREHGQADMGPHETFESNVRQYFRTLSADDTAEQKLEDFSRAVLDGASTVTVHPRGEEEVRRAERILQAQNPRDIYRYLPQDPSHIADRKIERAAMPPQGNGAPGRQ